MATENVEALKSTLSELDYLLIAPSRLTILHDFEIGVGGFGDVCLATLDGSSKVAVKQLRIVLAQGTRVRVAMRLAREMKVWAKAKHPNILELVGYCLNENYTTAQLVSPYMANGNVMEYMKRTRASIGVRMKFVRDMTSGLAYLHDCNPHICHGDMKPANVLISDEPNAVLCDFGLATFVEDSQVSSGLTTSRSTKGSIRYMSPELFQESDSKHTLESDVWAWGCTVFEIITELVPYSTSLSDAGAIVAVVQGIPPGSTESLSSLVYTDDVPFRSALGALQDLIPNCWKFDPNQRPPLSSILQRLHSFSPQEPVTPSTKSPELGLSTNQKTDQTPGKLANEPTSQRASQSVGRVLQGNVDEIEFRTLKTGSATVPDAPEIVLSPLHDNNVPEVEEISFSPNGKWLATCYSNGISRVWNVEQKFTEQSPFPSGKGRLSWSPDSRYLVLVDSKGLHIWTPKWEQSKFYSNISSWWIDRKITWFSNGDYLALLDANRIDVMRCRSGQVERVYRDHLIDRVRYTGCIASVPMDRVGGQKIILIVADVRERELEGVSLVRHKARELLGSKTKSPSPKSTILVYDADTRKILEKVPMPGILDDIKVSRNGKFLIFPVEAGRDGVPGVELWRITAPAHRWESWNIQFVRRYSAEPNLALLDRVLFGGNDDEWIFEFCSGRHSDEGVVYVWDMQSKEPSHVIEAKGDRQVFCLSCGPTNEGRAPLWLACGLNTGEVVVWKCWKPSPRLI